LRDLWDLLCKISDHRTKKRSAQKNAKITKIQSPQVNAGRPGLGLFCILRFWRPWRLTRSPFAVRCSPFAWLTGA
jgi:hypothetical protein